MRHAISRTRWLVLIVVVIESCGCGSRQQHVYFGGDIAGYYRQRPSFIHVASDENIKQIRWASWGGKTASASGTMLFKAAYGLPPAPLKLKLKNIHKCGKRLVYLRLVVTSVSGAPFWALHNINYTC